MGELDLNAVLFQVQEMKQVVYFVPGSDARSIFPLLPGITPDVTQKSAGLSFSTEENNAANGLLSWTTTIYFKDARVYEYSKCTLFVDHGMMYETESSEKVLPHWGHIMEKGCNLLEQVAFVIFIVTFSRTGAKKKRARLEEKN